MIEELRIAWKNNSDWRLGQLIANAVRDQTGAIDCDPFYVEDDMMRQGIQRWLEGRP